MTMRPQKPMKILAVSLIPGVGHVMLGLPHRGLMFIFFMLVLGWISTKLMPATATFIGQHIGGVFIYGMSVLDAFRIGKVRYMREKSEV